MVYNGQTFYMRINANIDKDNVDLDAVIEAGRKELIEDGRESYIYECNLVKVIERSPKVKNV